MALTIITPPPLHCFVGGNSQEGNYIPLVATSNLFPTNTADTARTILAKGLTASGFFWIEVNSTHAAQFPVNSYVQLLGVQALILDSSTPANYRIVLNISDPGVIAGVTTVNKFYKDWGIEVEVQSATRTIRRVFNTGNIDLSDMLRTFIVSNLERNVEFTDFTADSFPVTIRRREVFLGHSNTFANFSPDSLITRGRIEAGDTGAVPGFFGERPETTYVVNGQRVPLAFYAPSGGTYVEDYSAYEFSEVISSGNRQRLKMFDIYRVNSGLFNEARILGQRRRFVIVDPCFPWIEIHWRDSKGAWNSHWFYVTDKRRAVQKDEQYRRNAIEQATSFGAEIQHFGQRYLEVNAQDVWTLQTGKIADQDAKWLRSLMTSDEVFYRDRDNLYPINVLPSTQPYFAESQLAEITLEIISAFTLQLRMPQKPIPINPIDAIWNAYVARAIEDGGTAPNAVACVRARFDEWYIKAYNDYVKEQGLNNVAYASYLYSKVGKVYSQIGSDWTVVRGSTATYVDSDGLLKIAANNVARHDFTNGGCGALLVEGEATNLLLRSEEFDNASWSKSQATITPNAISAPNGTITADLLIDEAVLQQHTVRQNVTTAGQQVTFSVFAKQNTISQIHLRNGNVGASSFFDLINGVVISQGAGQLAAIRSFGNGWYRCSISFISISGTQQCSIGNAQSGNISYLGAGLSSYIWGAQLETGSVATSYIPTGASTVTRLADQITKVEEQGGTMGIYEFEDGTNQADPSAEGFHTMPFGRNVNFVEVEE